MDDIYNYISSASNELASETASMGKTIEGLTIWAIVAFVIAILCSVLVYFLFIKSKTNFKGAVKTIRDYLNCDLIHIEALAKMFYYAATIYVVLTSINVLISYCTAKQVGMGLFEFFKQLILGPIIVRFAFEIVMMFVRIWKNTENLKK